MQDDGPQRRGELRERRSRYREEILAIVGHSADLVSAQDIHAALRRGGARTGLSTVYRELHALVRAREIDEFHLTEQALYRLREGQAEGYLVCDRCSRIEPAPPGWTAIVLNPKTIGFLDPRSPLSIHGRCADCTALTARPLARKP